MKKIVSSWILLTSVVALALSVAAFTEAAESSASTAAANSSTDKTSGATRPALRGERALGPFSIFDANHDGVLSEDEVAKSADVLRQLDKDHDGKISAAELRPNGGRPPRPERERDRDNDDDNTPPPRRPERPATAPKTNTSTAR